MTIVFTAPLILFPLLAPDIKLASGPGSIITNDQFVWPGMWLVVAYLVFLIAAPLGSFMWAFAYYLTARVYNRGSTYGLLVALQALLYTGGVYGATILMSYVGFVEGNLIAGGVSPLVATQVGGWTVYPIGGLIGAGLLGVLLGLLNLLLTLRRKEGSAYSSSRGA